MPWKETCPMDEKVKFIGDYLKDEWTLAELSRMYGVSRKTAHKWVNRYKKRGMEGMRDLSRAPRRHPNQTCIEIEDEIICFRKAHETWGPKKLMDKLMKKKPGVDWPSISTAGMILRRHGLVKKRRSRRQVPPYSGTCSPGIKANDVWAVDFKGWFRTQDGTRIDPLTISDSMSRYLIRCQGMIRPDMFKVKTQFELAFREYGLPLNIRSDNGPPFASVGLGGLSKLSVWWVKLGIWPERIRCGHPEENGRHERLHRTLKAETARPPKGSPLAQQKAFDVFQQEYNEERPHEALSMDTPSQWYVPSHRSYPSRLPNVEYSSEHTVRRVRSNGEIKWKGTYMYINQALIGEWIGLRQFDESRWAIAFGPLAVGVYDELSGKVKPIDSHGFS